MAPTGKHIEERGFSVFRFSEEARWWRAGTPTTANSA